MDHGDRFAEIANESDAIEALQQLGYTSEARRVVMNTISLAMIADCLHHLYEALKCLEKRKLVVALNLLRKPLKESLIYLAWMYEDSDDFYAEFMRGSPHGLSQSRLGNTRREILASAIRKLDSGYCFDVESLIQAVYRRENPDGLERYFQHAVHLVTTKYEVTRTSPQNFNFIFKNPLDDDVYEVVYGCLPYVLCFLSFIVIELFNEMKGMDKGARSAFRMRAILGMQVTEGSGASELAQALIGVLETNVSCPDCEQDLKVTRYNMARILLTESYRCTSCRRSQSLPFSYLF